MSRSYKHNTAGGNATPQSEKRDKQRANRRLRKATRGTLSAILRGDMSVWHLLPILRDVSDPWGFAKDGKKWYGRGVVERYPKLMRK